MQKEVLVQKFAEAIARQEGFYSPGKRAARNNNPGNLRPYNKEQARDADGFRTFGKPEWGWDALRMQIWRNIKRELTFLEFFAGKTGIYKGFSPSADGNRPVEYAKAVVASIGLEPISAATEPIHTVISDYFDG